MVKWIALAGLLLACSSGEEPIASNSTKSRGAGGSKAVESAATTTREGGGATVVETRCDTIPDCKGEPGPCTATVTSSFGRCKTGTFACGSKDGLFVLGGPSFRCTTTDGIQDCLTAEFSAYVSSSHCSAGTGGASGRGGAMSVVLTGTSGATQLTQGGTAGEAALDASAGEQVQSMAGAGSTELPTAKVVLVYDSSGSMGDDPTTNRMNAASRWEPIRKAVSLVLSDPAMMTVEIAIIFFPEGTTKEEVCGHDYSVPVVPMTSASDPDLPQAILDRETGGQTPTLSALSGAYAYAQQIADNSPTANVRVVLLTDGEPSIYNGKNQLETDCAPAGSDLTNTIGDVSALAAFYASLERPINTHVFGIGEAQADMENVATSGGGQFLQGDATTLSAKSAFRKLKEDLLPLFTQ